jgi:hypothetical protein
MQAVKMFGVAVVVLCAVAASSVTELRATEDTLAIKRFLSRGSHLPPTNGHFTGGIPPVCPTGGCASK